MGVIAPWEWTPSGLSGLGYRLLRRMAKDSRIQKTIWRLFTGTAVAAARDVLRAEWQRKYSETLSLASNFVIIINSKDWIL